MARHQATYIFVMGGQEIDRYQAGGWSSAVTYFTNKYRGLDGEVFLKVPVR